MSRRSNLAQQTDTEQRDDNSTARRISLTRAALQFLQKIGLVDKTDPIKKPSPVLTDSEVEQEDMMAQLEDFNAIADTFAPDQLSVDELKHEVARVKAERARGQKKS